MFVHSSVSAFDPAQWVTPDDVAELMNVATDAQRQLACTVAAETLHRFSAQQYGTRDYVSRPVQLTNCGCSYSGVPRCGRLAAALVFPQPIVAVVTDNEEPEEDVTTYITVKIDGVELDPSGYNIYNNRTAYRIDDSWPCCQDLALADDELNTFSVTWRGGVSVPEGGQLAAKELAAEIGRAITHDQKCKLPQRVQNVTRQGVSMAIIDSLDYLKEKRTGLTLVDQWLASVNPEAHQQAHAKVFNPDNMAYSPT